ncbi:MAG TPA: CvpA family protein [Rhizomicrobium sp.]|jgi:membrane protein required for colicin V production|nr:CvpA family protein [Rhizomicrobium sp.]
MTLPITMVDVLAGLVVLVSAGYAAWRGFLSEVLSVFAWASAAFATLYFGPWLIPLMRGVIATPWIASLAAYAGIFLLVLIPLSFMAHRFSETVKHSPIGPLDRALGIAFGVVRGLVVVGLAYMAFTYFVPIKQQPTVLTQARSLPIIQSSAEVLLSLAPGRNYADFAKEPGARHDELGDLIRRNSDANKLSEDHVQHKGMAAKPAQKAYGAKDRRALDNLLEATGNGGSSKP